MPRQPESYWSTRIYWYPYPALRHYSRRELLADAIINILGLLALAPCAIHLAWGPAAESQADMVRVAVRVYGIAVITMQCCSTLYNLFAWTSARRVQLLKLADHVGIVLAIAGSHTTALCLAGCYKILYAMWASAIACILLKVVHPVEIGPAQIACLLTMGCAPLSAWGDAVPISSRRARMYAIAACLTYIAGMVPFGLYKIEGHTALWHAFVLLGCALTMLGHWELVEPSGALGESLL